MTPAKPLPGDALVVIDMQTDFVAGSLLVPQAAALIPGINACIREFDIRGLPVFATRDWHPRDHASFREQGGPWPSHCVAGTPGAAFAPGLKLPAGTLVISKAATPHHDAYSAFAGTNLGFLLANRNVRRLFVAGVATEYCVFHTVIDALRLGYEVLLLADAVAAVEARTGDGVHAERQMLRAGAKAIRVEDVIAAEPVDG